MFRLDMLLVMAPEFVNAFESASTAIEKTEEALVSTKASRYTVAVERLEWDECVQHVLLTHHCRDSL